MHTEASVQKTVLVVEDDPWTRIVTTALLAGEGYAVVEAKSGEEGLQQAADRSPDVILLDLALPTMSGIEVLQELKQSARHAGIPVIVVSAYGSLMKDADTRQVAAVLQKPFDYDHLVGEVARATARAAMPALALQ